MRFRVLPLLALQDIGALAHIRVAALASTRCRAFCRGTETKAPGGKEAVMYAEHMSMPVHFHDFDMPRFAELLPRILEGKSVAIGS